jgi:pimeloyl-ACP methyl ester carboxylesterase
VPFGRHLSNELKVNICAYDYTGYGCSSGEPNIMDTYADIEAVVDHLVRARGTDPQRIVLYGQSIGSGPSCQYAARCGGVNDSKVAGSSHGAGGGVSRRRGGYALAGSSSGDAKGNDAGGDSDGGGGERGGGGGGSGGGGGGGAHEVGGVVLVSPIMSGLKVISPPVGLRVASHDAHWPALHRELMTRDLAPSSSNRRRRLLRCGPSPPDGCCNPACVFALCDIYPNHTLVPRFTCPTLVVHGGALHVGIKLTHNP